MSVNQNNITEELETWYECYLLHKSFDRIHPFWKKLDTIDISSEQISKTNIPKKPCMLKMPSKTFSLDPVVENYLQNGSLAFEKIDEIPCNLVQTIQNFSGEQQIGSSFQNCRMKNLKLFTCNCNLFKDLSVINTSAIYADSYWFTPAHIEEAGHDSCAYLGSGLKIWFGATNLNASRYLVSKLTYPHKLINMLMRAPSKDDTESFRYHIFEPGQLILQPALLAHTVITFNIPGKTSFIAGWEAANLFDTFRVIKVLDYFGTGYERLIWRKAYEKGGLNELRKFIDSLNSCELKTHFYALLNANYSMENLDISTKFQSIPRRKQKAAIMLQNRKK